VPAASVMRRITRDQRHPFDLRHQRSIFRTEKINLCNLCNLWLNLAEVDLARVAGVIAGVGEVVESLADG